MSSVSLLIYIHVRFSCLIVLSVIKLRREVTLQLLCSVNKGESTLFLQFRSTTTVRLPHFVVGTSLTLRCT